MKLRYVPCFAAVLFAISVSGCAGWHAAKGLPAEYIAKEKPDVVRLSLGDSSLVLSRPGVRGDSVVGLQKSAHPHRWIGVPAAEIRGMEIHSARGTTSGKIIAGSVIGAAVLIGVAAAIGGGTRLNP